MNTRLKIICILFGLAYIFIIGDAVGQMLAFDMPAEYQIDNPYQYGLEYGSRIRESLGDVSPFWGLFFPGIVVTLLSVVTIGLLIYVPIQTYKIIRSIVEDNIFDAINIKRIRKIGYALLITFVINLPIYPIVQYLYRIMFGISDTSQLGSFRDDYSLLLFGLLVLLFAEVLKISTSIKEENDLTV